MVEVVAILTNSRPEMAAILDRLNMVIPTFQNRRMSAGLGDYNGMGSAALTLQ
jgi:hypothetical protein